MNASNVRLGTPTLFLRVCLYARVDLCKKSVEKRRYGIDLNVYLDSPAVIRFNLHRMRICLCLPGRS